MVYKLNPSLNCQLTNRDTLFIDVPDGESIECKENIDFFVELFHKIDGFNSIEDIKNSLVKVGYDIELENLIELVKQLEIKNILKKKITLEDLDTNGLSYDELNKYDRQIRNFSILKNTNLNSAIEFQKKIKHSKVTIIGVGGIGSYLAYSLVAMGIGEIRLIDRDSIELSNTSRQMLYDESNIGKLKIDVAEEKLKKVNPRTNIKTKNIFVDDSSIEEVIKFIDGSDLIVSCADLPRGKIPYIINEIANRLNVPWMLYGPFHFYKIFCGPLIIPGFTKDYNKLFPKEEFKDDNRINEINSRIESNIMDPYNGLAAKVASIEIVKFLTGYEKPFIINNRLIIDTKNWKIQKYDVLSGEFINEE